MESPILITSSDDELQAPSVPSSERSRGIPGELPFQCKRSASQQSSPEFHSREPPIKKLRAISIVVPESVYPKSQYRGWKPPQRILSEPNAIHELKFHHSRLHDEADVYIILSAFSIYRPGTHKWHGGTMAPLNDLLTRHSDSEFLFEGVLTLGSQSRYVKDVAFETLAIDGYEKSVPTVKDKIYIQSPTAQNARVWYSLSEPSNQYKRFHMEFLWLADFTKHFICYLRAHRNVRLANFKAHFYLWIRQAFDQNDAVDDWLDIYGRRDFRAVVVNNPEYLFSQSVNHGVDHESRNRDHFLWKEVHPSFLGAVKQYHNPLEKKTLVTPYVFDCFKHLYFADQLEPRSLTNEQHHQWPYFFYGKQPRREVSSVTDHILPPTVRIGDVIGIRRDQQSVWKDKADVWYAYVHDKEVDRKGRVVLHVFWLYRPEDTVCSAAYYPFKNELFFSDHCNCKCRQNEKIYTEDVVEFPATSFINRPIRPDQGFFIRSTYITGNMENRFVTFEKTHSLCEHRSVLKHNATFTVAPGDTVLVQFHRWELLEPVEIDQVAKDGTLRIRLLLRLGREFGINSKANELAYSDIIRPISRKQIQRRCFVRFYTRAEILQGLVPAPYCFNGAADCWIVSSRLLDDGRVGDLEPPYPPSLVQGFDRGLHYPGLKAPLHALDLFCGGGNFSRGIEESGAAQVKWSVDTDGTAIHTKRANLKDPDDGSLFWGSAIHYLQLAMDGQFSRAVAAIGDVDLILAGSPCQGFSDSQPDKNSNRSRKNASMITLALAFIDFYRPKFALLENVFGLTRKLGQNKDQQVFAQIFCALVGMGYQVQYYNVDAFNFGDSQKRSRVFIAIAAPGEKPLRPMGHTHSTPEDIGSRSFGKTVNGELFGARERQVTPFLYVSAGAATSHLPRIGDGFVGLCAAHPDHRLSRKIGWKRRAVCHRVPYSPRGSCLVQAKEMDSAHGCFNLLEFLRPNAKSRWLNNTNKAYTRVDPDRLFDTIVTTCSPEDTQNGRWLHWDEPRPLTIAEARIAQSIPAHEVIVGTPAQQWRIVGNSVDRYVAVTFGVNIRQSWFGSEREIESVSREHVSYEHNDISGTNLNDQPRISETPEPVEVFEEQELIGDSSPQTMAKDSFVIVQVSPISREKRSSYLLYESASDTGSQTSSSSTTGERLNSANDVDTNGSDPSTPNVILQRSLWNSPSWPNVGAPDWPSSTEAYVSAAQTPVPGNSKTEVTSRNES